METSFQIKLIDILKTDARFIDQDGELVKAAIIDRAWKIDRELVKLLLSDASIKQKFFDEIEGHWVFNINTFIDYISDKDFLDNSYTRFRNKIGLNIDGKYLEERGEVCLVWPYKDCVLEGGQTKEEEKRKEIFFNEILAQDEIDRLLDPKVLTNWKRYTTDGEQAVSEIRRDKDGVIKENLLIKGNNLLALHTLKTHFRDKIKLIYIDPPYNTGNDSFGYNDAFLHSSWLTFMRNRLNVALNILSHKGAIALQVDDNELAYAAILMDEVFGRENCITIVTLARSAATGHKAINPAPVNAADYILIYAKDRSQWQYIQQYVSRDYDTAYNLFIDRFDEGHEFWEFQSLQKILKEKEMSIEEAINSFPERIARFAVPSYQGVGKEIRALIDKSKKQPKNIFRQKRDKYPDIFLKNGQRILFYKDKVREIDGKMTTTEAITNIWTDIAFQGIAREGNVVLLKGKKPEKLLRRIIEMGTSNDDIVLDFCLGSGTTAAVAHKLGRQYIGIEQLEYGKNDSIIRLQNVIHGEQAGISKAVNWQGGGDFIYCELMKCNEVYMDRIQNAESSEELVKLWKDIAENSFLNWYINFEAPEDAINDFIEIGKAENGLEKQKRLLCELLNKNQLYVNLSEIDDAKFSVTEHDKELNKQFYGDAYNA